MKNYLIGKLKKTKLRNPIGTEIKYSSENKPWSNQIRAEVLAVTSFGSQQFNIIPPEAPISPNELPINYIALENGTDFIITENNINLIA